MKLSVTITSFSLLFDEYKEIYAPSEKVAQPIDSQDQPSNDKRLMRTIINHWLHNNGGANATIKSKLDKYFLEDNERTTKCLSKEKHTNKIALGI